MIKERIDQSHPIYLTVSQLTGYIRELLEGDDILHEIWVQGEISNLARPSSGHIYFTIKDQGSQLRCVMWRTNVMRMKSLPKDGEAVEVHGSIGVYEVQGIYQLYADTIRPAGEGALYLEYLRLKAQLESEGLFDMARKRPIPNFPKRIGIVTSPTGAALQDILNTLRRRYALADIIVAPTPVQGDEAPLNIVGAIEKLNQLGSPDVILVARGGGSIEDLWAFNDERVARAIAASTAPVITGIGHETDFTIADFVSDMRAPTPTAAAELSTPNRADLLVSLKETTNRMSRSFQAYIIASRSEIERQNHLLSVYSPSNRLRSYRQKLDELAGRAQAEIQHIQKLQRIRINGLSQQLSALSATSVLKRGFSIVRLSDHSILRHVSQAQAGKQISIQVSDGTFSAVVQDEPTS